MEIRLNIAFFYMSVIGLLGFTVSAGAQDYSQARLAEVASISAISVDVSGKLALCSHSEKGSIILDIKGGTPPYSFEWNTRETTQNRTNLYAGTYTVEITDSEGVVHVERIVVQPPYPLILEDLEKRDASCGSGKDGYAKIGVKIGRGEPYKVTWSHGLEDSWEASDLAPGTYTVTVADMYNCDVTMSFEIESENEAIEIAESIKDIDCSSPNSGEINLSVSGGQAPYQYSWSHGPTTQNVTGLSAGAYSVMIIDQTGCGYQASFNLAGPAEVQIDSAVEEPSCGDNNDGSIVLELSGGQAPYIVNWSNGQSGNSLFNITAGTYSATIIDALGCETQKSFALSSSADLDLRLVEVHDVACFNGKNGKAVLELDGDVEATSILWSDGLEGALEREDLIPGEYTVIARNEEGCSVEVNFAIEAPQELTARIESTLDVDCAVGSVEGVAWVSIEGGVEPYTVEWNQSSATNREINFDQSTVLRVTVTDAGGCSVQTESRVDFPAYGSTKGRLDFEYRKLEINTEPEVQVDEEIIFESEISEDFIAWEWSFGDGNSSSDKDPIHVFSKSGTYEVVLTGYDIYGCSSQESNIVQVTSPEEMVVIPNAFTPNGDGLNDTFKAKVKSVSSFSMDLFNTWGERIYSTTSVEAAGWDGTHRGQLAPPGNYLYKISYRTLEGEAFHRTGGVTLIR